MGNIEASIITRLKNKSKEQVAPSGLKEEGVMIKAYPPISFEFKINGAHAMEYRIVNKKAFRIVGVKLHTTLENEECFKSVPSFWNSLMQAGGQNDILALMNQEPAGLLGVSKYSDNFTTGAFDYYIACSSDKPALEGMEEFIVPEATYAIFCCSDTKADTIQKLENSIVMEWLPTSGYEFSNAPDIELYDMDGKTEIWLPIRKRERK